MIARTGLVAGAVAGGVASLGLAVAACGHTGGGAPLANHSAAPSGGVRAIDWRNRSYSIEGIGDVQVVDGRADFALDDDGKLATGKTGESISSQTSSGQTSSGQTSAAFTVDRPVFADVDGDGVEDAVVACVLGTGGTGQFSAVRIFTLRGGGQVVELGEVLGGDRGDGGIRRVAVDGGAIVVDRNVLAEGDGACCASTWRRERWIWRDGAPVEDVAARGALQPVP